MLVNFLRGNSGTTCHWQQRAYNNVSAGSLPPVPPEGRTPRLSLACRGQNDGSDIWWLSRKTFKLLGPSIGQIFPGRFSTGYSSGSSWSGFLRVLRFPPPEKLISSSSFHCLDMTLAVAEAINPDKLNQTEDFHKTPCLEDTPCTRCVLKLNLSLQSKFCGSAGSSTVFPGLNLALFKWLNPALIYC